LAPTLRTIGYEGRTASEVIDALITAGVEVLVDVRDLPLSRKRGLSKTALRATAEEAGLEYRHAKALGNPKENRERYRSGDAAGGAAFFRARLRGEAADALRDLGASVETEQICLLCFERDPAACHRILIVEALEQRIRGLRVEHL
jgi:uncharacterized protein (DUF488 family)